METDFKTHVNQSLNNKVKDNKKDASYFSKEKVLKREKDRISYAKRWRALNTIVKTKKKHL